jgi:hypothetical protein
MRLKREHKFIACLSGDGLQAVIVAQNEVIAHRSGADEHFRQHRGSSQSPERTHTTFVVCVLR